MKKIAILGTCILTVVLLLTQAQYLSSQNTWGGSSDTWGELGSDHSGMWGKDSGFLPAGSSFPIRLPSFTSRNVDLSVIFMRNMYYNNVGFTDEKGNFINPTGIGFSNLFDKDDNPPGTFLVTMNDTKHGIAFNPPSRGTPMFVSKIDYILLGLEDVLKARNIHYNVVRDREGVIMSDAIPSFKCRGIEISNIIYTGLGEYGPIFSVLKPGQSVSVIF